MDIPSLASPLLDSSTPADRQRRHVTVNEISALSGEVQAYVQYLHGDRVMLKTAGLLVLVWMGVHWSYAAVMGGKAAIERGELTLYWKIILSPLALIGFVLDVIFQFTFGFMFAEFPRELLFSSRVQRHYRQSTGWRRRLAGFWARNLNVFDPFHIR